jgi:hypothetical protein
VPRLLALSEVAIGFGTIRPLSSFGNSLPLFYEYGMLKNLVDLLGWDNHSYTGIHRTKTLCAVIRINFSIINIHVHVRQAKIKMAVD